MVKTAHTLSILFIIWCPTFLFQSSICNGQSFLVASWRELQGLSKTYKNQGFVPKPDCEHEKRRTVLKFKNLTMFTTCFAEFTRQGHIQRHPDQHKRTDRIIRDNGYNFVTYNNITSADGYVQTLFRVTGSPKSPPRKGKPAVLLFHGAGGASDAWVLLGEKGLAFNLVNAGFEAWLLNSRGTDYSMRHIKYKPNWDMDYWNFSFHEMAIYDVPIIIDLMIEETGTSKVFFIGHSLGSVVYTAAVAERPELNDKIHAGFIFGSGSTMHHATAPAKLLSAYLDLDPMYQKLVFIANRGRIEAGSPILNNFRSQLCSATALFCNLCGIFVTAYTGHPEPDIKYTTVPYLMSVLPNSVGLKVILHGAQNHRNCAFHKYDYGSERNLQMYGQSEPPLYDLKNVRAPVHIYYGEGDDFSPVEDVKIFRDSLPPGTVRGFYKIPWKEFNHFDYIANENVDVLLYNKLIEDMKQYIV